MADVHTPAQRSHNMSRVRSRDTKPEMFIRSMLHKLGFRFRLHRKDLPGCPDIVLPKYRGVIFVHGCFWHKHECHLFKWPSTRQDFWKAKINHNHKKDLESRQLLISLGWRVCTVWECSLKGPKRDHQRVSMTLEKWILSGSKQLEVVGSKG